MSNATRARSTAASRVGVTVDEYAARIASGEKWCTGCKSWHRRVEFVRNRGRGDGLDSKCRVACRTRPRSKRDPLHEKARHVVEYAVRTGRLPRPDSLPCTDCEHLGDEKRHEYDHYLGYEIEHHLDVEPVCTTCHAGRELRRKLSPDAARCRP